MNEHEKNLTVRLSRNTEFSRHVYPLSSSLVPETKGSLPITTLSLTPEHRKQVSG